MKNSIKLFSIFGISIQVHLTFFLLLLLVIPGGVRWVFLVFAVFFFVTLHELCHSLTARSFGIKVRDITLLPIGGVSSMSKMPEKPFQELAIAVAGPLSNIIVLIVFFFPMKYLVGLENLFHPLSTQTWKLTFAYVYWINLALAGFNLLPAFPMDGGRVLRAILATRMSYRQATHIAVNFGHVFALAFAYFGIVKFNLILIIIAVFIYLAASNEELQVDVKEVLKKYRVYDILPRDFLKLKPETELAKVLEMIFHSHQEDFPVIAGEEMVGFVTRQDVMKGIHSHGMTGKTADVMHPKVPKVKEADSLMKAQALMHEAGLRALPVFRDGSVVGVITVEDIGRVYAMMSHAA